MPIATSVQWIDRISLTERTPEAEATLTLHYEECCEKSQTTFSILEVQGRKVEVSVVSGEKQTYDFVNDIHTIELRPQALVEFNAWFQRNMLMPEL